MRILVVNKFYWMKGGSERVLFDLCAGYEAAGHEVIPFSMQSARNVASPWADHFVPEIDYSTARGSARLRAAGNVIYSGEAKRRLAGLIATVRPDVAHLHNFHHQLSPSIVDALREAEVPAVHTLHDYKVICPNYLLYTEGAPCERCRGGRFHHVIRHRCVRDSRGASLVAWAEMTWHRWRRTLERGIRSFVSPSRFLADKLVEFGVTPSRVVWVPNGIELGDFTPTEDAGEGFLYAGRLSHEKGLGTLLGAVARTPEIRLTIAGTGPEEEALRRRAEVEAPGRVDFLGYVSRGELLERIRSARAVVMPSEWYENAPMSALESLASGVPLVASAIGGIPEIVRDGETGLLFPTGQVDALAERLRRLEAEPARARDLGRRGRQVVEREFTLAGQVDRMLQLLEEVSSSASR